MEVVYVKDTQKLNGDAIERLAKSLTKGMSVQVVAFFEE